MILLTEWLDSTKGIQSKVLKLSGIEKIESVKIVVSDGQVATQYRLVAAGTAPPVPSLLSENPRLIYAELLLLQQATNRITQQAGDLVREQKIRKLQK